MAILLVGLLLLLTGCFGKPRIGAPNTYRPVDENGEVIVNAFTIASDYMMYFGIMSVIAGILMIIILRMVKTGGICIITGVACFAFAQLLNYIGAHLGLFITAAIALTGLVGFLYYKAVTTSLPWLEKVMDKDLNRDGHVGTSALEKREQDEPMTRHNEGLT